MIVAQVIGELRVGGAERLFVDLCNALEVDKTIVVLLGDTSLQRNLRNELHANIEVREVRVRKRSFFVDIWKLARLMRDMGCDVVHSHMYWPNFYGSLAARLGGVPVIVTSEHGRNQWKRRWHRWLEVHATSRFADARLCVSKDILQRRRDVDGIPEELLRLIPNGTVVRPRPRDSERRPSLVGSVGRLVGAKDYPTLIRAVSILVHRGVEVQLEIVGEGPEREKIQSTINEERVGAHVKLLGIQSNVGDWLARWSIFASSSVEEGQPVALLEAMSAGLPCVATAVGGVPDTLSDGVEGIVVPPGRPDVLADALEKLLTDGDLCEGYGQAAREHVIREFSIESLAGSCKQIYEAALERKASA